jgi:hypothetical protein
MLHGSVYTWSRRVNLIWLRIGKTAQSGSYPEIEDKLEMKHASRIKKLTEHNAVRNKNVFVNMMVK